MADNIDITTGLGTTIKTKDDGNDAQIQYVTLDDRLRRLLEDQVILLGDIKLLLQALVDQTRSTS